MTFTTRALQQHDQRWLDSVKQRAVDISIDQTVFDLNGSFYHFMQDEVMIQAKTGDTVFYGDW